MMVELYSVLSIVLIETDPMLLIYNIDGSHEDSIPLECVSLGITVIDNSTVAVTLYNTIHCVDMYDINNKVKLKSIALHDIYSQIFLFYITTINNNIVVGIHNSIVIIDHQTGEVVKTIDTGGISTCCLHSTSDKIFYCDDLLYNNNNIYCYSYCDDQVDIMTLPSIPQSITSLQDGSVYVTCRNGSVQHVSSDGKSYKTVTTEGLLSMEKLSKISYNPKQRKLVITCTNNDKMVKVFDEV